MTSHDISYHKLPPLQDKCSLDLPRVICWDKPNCLGPNIMARMPSVPSVPRVPSDPKQMITGRFPGRCTAADDPAHRAAGWFVTRWNFCGTVVTVLVGVSCEAVHLTLNGRSKLYELSYSPFPSESSRLKLQVPWPFFSCQFHVAVWFLNPSSSVWVTWQRFVQPVLFPWNLLTTTWPLRCSASLQVLDRRNWLVFSKGWSTRHCHGRLRRVPWQNANLTHFLPTWNLTNYAYFIDCHRLCHQETEHQNITHLRLRFSSLETFQTFYEPWLHMYRHMTMDHQCVWSEIVPVYERDKLLICTGRTSPVSVVAPNFAPENG